jgi:alkyldihydroxyacetonephosphate synthase
MTKALWLPGLQAVLPPERISTLDDDLLRHSYDTWPMATKWRQLGKQDHRPDVVVRPTHTVEVSCLLSWASKTSVAVTPWGAGSSVTGAPLPTRGGVSLDLSAMNQVLWLDEMNLMVKVQAGVMGHVLEADLNRRGYTLNHSPQSLDRSTVGGWVATRATGQFSSRWGGIEDLALAITVVLPTGEIVETRLAPRAAIGPRVLDFFVGSEGTLGVVTEVTLKIFPVAATRIFEAVRFADVDSGLKAMRLITRAGLRPFLARFYDEDESRRAVKDAGFTGCAFFLACEGQNGVAHAEHEECLAICRAEGGVSIGPEPVVGWMGRRFDFSLIENILNQPGGVAETIEIAHFWDRIGATYRALKVSLAPLATEVLGHFSHLYPQGISLYMILLGLAEGPADAEERLAKIWEVSMETCLEMGAVTSHHHGVGLARLPYIRQDVGSGMVVLDKVKAALDPAGIMNPGKLGFDS